jgi:ATP-binding cassette subfamily B protein
MSRRVLSARATELLSWARGATISLRRCARLVGDALRASPLLAVVTVACTAVAAVGPLATLAAVAAVVGDVPGLASGGLGSAAGRSALSWAAVVGALFALQRGAASLQSGSAAALGERVDHVLQRRLMAGIMAPPGIAHLEDSRTLDLISVGRDVFRGWLRPGRLVTSLSTLAAARLTVLGSCLILLRFRWPLALVLLAALLWAEREARAAATRAAQHHYGGSPLARRTEYFSNLGVTPPAAKEVRVFGLPDLLVERFSTTWGQAMSVVFAERGVRPLLAAAGLAGAALLTLGWLGVEAARGGLGITATMVYAQAVLVSLAGLGVTTNARVQTQMGLAALERYEAAAEAVTAPTEPRPGGLPVGAMPEREIRFEGVGFRYPGLDRDVVHDLDLTIPAGRSLAIVGANGAGKTTVVKLLAGLYRPDRGRIRVDGVDLADLDPAAWQRRIAAVFQDSVHYEMAARTNVAFGRVEAQADRAGIEAAAAQVGLAREVERLGRGWDTVLSRQYHDGAELSGGQWQKVALARALFAVRHGAGVLVLDEPAANLDARAEAELYAAFLTLTAGVTTIVISHRFSTVRQASSIAVIRDGHVAEQGTHEALLRLGGQYAEMFRIQAARFGDAVPSGQGGGA